MSFCNRIYIARVAVIVMVAATVLFFSSCLSPHDIVTADVDPLGWNDPVSVTRENADTLSAYRINVVVRYDRSMELASLPLSIETMTPDSLRIVEQVVVPVAHHPASHADFEESVASYRTDVVFARTGAYTFQIKPAPEVNDVKGITAVGIEFLKDE